MKLNELRVELSKAGRDGIGQFLAVQRDIEPALWDDSKLDNLPDYVRKAISHRVEDLKASGELPNDGNEFTESAIAEVETEITEGWLSQLEQCEESPAEESEMVTE